MIKVSFFIVWLLLCLGFCNQTKAQVQKGDIAIIGFNSDSSPDEMAIVTLAEIPVGEKIYISDYPWTGSAFDLASTSNGALTWTTTSIVPAGTVLNLTISTPSSIGGDLANFGSVAAIGWTGTAAAVAVASGGDSWLIYQGTSPTSSPTNWIFGFANWSTTSGTNPNEWRTSGDVTTTTSYLPSSLTLGVDAVALTTLAGGHNDNLFFNGAQGPDKATVLAQITNPNNWQGNETVAQDISVGGINFSGTNPVFNISSGTSSVVTLNISFSPSRLNPAAPDPNGFEGSTWTFSFVLSEANYTDVGIPLTTTTNATLTISGASSNNGTYSLTNSTGDGSFAFVPENASDDILFARASNGSSSSFTVGTTSITSFSLSGASNTNGLANNAAIEDSHWSNAIISGTFNVDGIGFTTNSSPISTNDSGVGSGSNDVLYWLEGNTTQDLIKFNSGTNSTEVTRGSISTSGTSTSLIYNNSSTGSLNWYIQDFGNSHFFNIGKDFISSTNKTQLSSSADILENPRFLAYDSTNDRVFVTDINFTSQVTFIKSYDLNGLNPSSNLQSTSSTFTSYSGIALDVANSEMYWSDPNTASIFKSNMTAVGGTRTTIVNNLGANVKDIALDLVNRKVYWIDQGSGFNGNYQIRSADIDGTVTQNNSSIVTHYNISESNAYEASEIEINGDGSTIYWSIVNFGSSTSRVLLGVPSAINETTEPTALKVKSGATFSPRIAIESTQVTPSNTLPTASSFTANPSENLTYTFSTGDFSYSDSDSDPLDHIRITTIPAVGTLFVDANDNDSFDGGEAVSINDQVSKANLDAGNLQYIQNGSTNDSFAFDVNDGTAYSASTYTTTLTLLAVPTVTLSVSPSSRSESSTTNNVVTATLSNAYGLNTTVNLSFSGTAEGSSVDYSISSNTIVIPAGNNSGTINLNNVPDALFEGNETVIIDIASVTNGIENGTQQITYTIIDDDSQPTASLEVLDFYNPIIDESGGQAYVRANLDAVAGVAVSVPLIFSGTATGGGTDYSITGSTITLSPGETMDSIRVTSLFDGIEEGDETIIIDMGTPTNAIKGTPDQVTITINDEDAAVPSGYSVSIDQDPISPINESAVSFTFAGAEVGSTYNFTFSSSGGGSPVSGSGTIVTSTDQITGIDLSGLGAGTITLSATLTDPFGNVGAAATDTKIKNSITSVSVDNPAVTEGDAGSRNLTFTVSLSQAAPAGGATVDFATSDGTTIAGSDYTATSGTLSFAAGETSKTVDVTVTGDETVELDETLTLTLSNPTGTAVVIADGSGIGTITNDDQASVTIANVAVDENSGTATITLTLDNAVDGGFSVEVSTADGTATTADGDYTAVAAQALTFAGTAGETETFSITLGADTKVEVDETVSISMSNLLPVTVDPADLNITDGATLTINNDDQATLTIADVSGNEDDGDITVTVTLDNAVDGGFDVDVSTADGTATTANSDYTAVTGQTLSFAGTAGEIQTFTVTPTVDTNPEPNETVIISMNNVIAGTVSSGDIDITDGATVTIINDDDAFFSVNAPSVGEGNAGTSTLQFTVSLSAPAPAGGATIDFATSDGTAIAGSDYTATSGTLSFVAGETSKTVDVTVIGDETVELDETLTLTLSNPTGTAVVIADGSGIGTITNDDQAAVTIADVTVDENSGTATITLTLDYAVDGGFSVEASTADGTATTADGDYTAVIAQALTFAGTAGETETFSITLGADTKVEVDETVSISMSNLVPVTVDPADLNITDGATLTINNDDQTTVTMADVSGNEDDGPITVTATLDNAVDGGFTVDVSTADGTATTADNDYTAISGQTLTFVGTAGEIQTFTVTPTVDTNPEPNETVIIGMSNVVAGTVSSGDIDITDGATVTIINDDDAFFSVNDPSVAEGNTGTSTLQFMVSLSVPAPVGGATVDYATSDGTAIAGSDYIATSGTLSFAVGETSKTIDVTVIGDEIVELDETLTLTLSNPTGTGVLIGDGTGNGTITNDDQAIITIANANVSESDGNATISATLDNAVQGGFTVDVFTSDGTATTADSDYNSVITTLTFAGTAGEIQTFDIPIIDDQKVEVDETVSISMSNLAGTSSPIDISDDATLTISNDDLAILTIDDVSGKEDDGAITVTVSLSNSVAGGFTVNVSTTDGTATTADSDYTSIAAQTLTFVGVANETQTFTITPTADATPEPDETVIISMSGLVSAVPAGSFDVSDEATVTILNDDVDAPSTPDLAATSDSGGSDSDNITNDLTPTFTGTALVNSTVTVISDLDGVLGTTIVDGSGNWSFTATGNVSTGVHSITATATDFANNVSPVSGALSVTFDTQAPTPILIGGIVLQLDNNGLTPSITPTDFLNVQITDDFSASNDILLSLDKTSFDCSNIGNNTVTVTATDEAGNSDFATSSVEVQDVIDPTILAKSSITLNVDAFGTVDLNVGMVDEGSFDNCGIQSQVFSKSTFDRNDEGVNTITYTVTDVNGNPAQVNVQVTIVVVPKVLNIVTDSGQSKVYGDSDPVFTFTASGFEAGDDESIFTGALSRVSGENVGTYAINLGTLDAGPNYTINFTPANFEINPATLTITADAGQSKVYGEADPIFTYQAAGFENGDNENILTGVLSRVAGENVGNYTINQGTLDAGSNYTINYTAAEFEITPATLNITADAGQSKVYGNTDPVFSYQAMDFENGDDDGILTGSLSRVAGENVGNYTINQGTLDAGSNYTINYTAAEFEITPATLNITADSGKTKIYGDSDPVFTYQVSGYQNGDDESIFNGALARTAGEKVGIYLINLGTLDAGPNYTIDFTGADFTITTRTLNVTANPNQVKVFGSADPVFTYTASNFGNGDNEKILTGALSRVAGENVGNYTINQGTLDAGSNYTINYTAAEFEITPATLNITADAGQSKVYGNTDPVFSYQAMGFENGDDEGILRGSLSRVSGENVGNYTINQGTLDAGSNYTINYTTAEFEITPATLNITADSGKTKIYGDSDPVFTYQVSGYQNEDDESIFNGALGRIAGENVGTYLINLGTLDAGPNYTIDFTGADFTITTRTLNVTANPNQVKVFGSADPVFTYIASNFGNGDNPSILTGALSRVAGEDVGMYAITLGTLEAGSNYVINFTSSDFEIAEKVLNVVADAGQSKVFGTADPVFTYEVTGFEAGDDETILTGALARASGENVGTYPINLGNLDAGINYAINYTGADFEITPADITGITFNDESFVFDGTEKTLVISGTLPAGTSVAYANNTRTDVGTQEARATITGSNFNDLVLTADLTITPADITGITFDDGSFVFDGTEKSIEISGTLPAGTSVTYANNSRTDVGTQVVTATITGSNFNDLVLTADLTITSADITGITFDDGSFVFNGTEKTLVISGTLPVGTSVAYSNNTRTEVGTQEVTATITGSNYTELVLTAGLTITPAELTVIADEGQSKLFGETDPALTFTATGYGEGDDESIFTGALGREAGEAVGFYAINQGSLDAGVNYTINFTGADFEIITNDSDGDGVPDDVELADGTDPNDPDDFRDSDGDGVPDQVEEDAGTDPNDSSDYPDTDEDGVPDYAEEKEGSNPNNGSDFLDSDGDGVPDYVQDRSIVEFVSQSVTVAWGTLATEVPLAEEVVGITGLGEFINLGVSWNLTGFNPLIVGTNNYRGTVTLPAGLLNTYELEPIVSITVEPKPAPQDLSLSAESFIAIPDVFFQEIGFFTVVDPSDDVHEITLIDGAADNQYFEIIDGILFWSSAEQVSGRTQFTIRVRVTDRAGNTLDKEFQIERQRTPLDQLDIPNTFTPNNDGVNDTWGVPALRYYEGVQIQIIEVGSGNRVFYTEDPDVRWDGRVNGKEPVVTAYVWVITVVETGEVRRGMLNLLKQ